MWNDEYKKKTIRTIILAALCVITAAVLLILVVNENAKTDEEDARLLEQYAKRQTEQADEKQQAEAAVEAEYQKDLAAVLEYLPGIVCWGDTLTAGTESSVSYPDILQRLLNTYICDIYDFRSTISNADDFSRITWNNYTVSIPVINMGVANEDTATILGRSGAVPFILASNVTIPADSEKVRIVLRSEDGSAVSPLNGGNCGVNPVTIDGITGTLTLEDEHTENGHSYAAGYYFCRAEAGSEKKVAAGTEVITAAADLYRDYLHVVCIGTYGGYSSATELVSQVKALLSRQTKNTDRYLVIGICYQDGWADTSEYDSALVRAFGDHFVNLRKYLCSDGLSDAGISATSDDRACAASGIVPPSLRSAAGDEGLNAKAYKLLGKLVYDRMEKLGYFDEVVTELHIDDVRKSILKSSPYYFTNIVKSW